MRSRTALAIAGACAASLVLAPAALATFPGENGAIAFSRDGDIWTINPDGTGEKRLTSGAEHDDRSPEWSPDGTEILFERTGTGVAHVYRMKADGSGVTWITGGYSPSFSNDGTQITYGSGSKVVVANRDGSGPRTITDDHWYRYPRDWSPINDLILHEIEDNTDWIGASSPEGAQLSFSSDRRDDESTPGREDSINWEDAEWAPDGTRFVFAFALAVEHPCWDGPSPSCPPDPDVGINVVDLAGKRVVVHKGTALEPAFSPDGSRIVFWEGGSLKVMDADGANVRTLTSGADPDWQALHRPRIPHDPPAPPEPPTVTVTVPIEVPGPERVVEKVVTRVVHGEAERCVIPAGRRKLTLTIRTTKAVRKGASVKVTVDLATGKAKVARGKPYRARLH